MTWFKRKDFVPPLGRAPYPKKGEGSQSFRQLQKGRGSFVYGGSSEEARRADTRGYFGGQNQQEASTVGRPAEQREPTNSLCMRCNQKHPGDCSATLRRCYICRGEGHRWRDCQYLGRGCFHYGDTGHRKRECPSRATKVVQRQRATTQSQQQSVTVNRPV
jgi:hypothetical protein